MSDNTPLGEFATRLDLAFSNERSPPMPTVLNERLAARHRAMVAQRAVLAALALFAVIACVVLLVQRGGTPGVSGPPAGEEASAPALLGEHRRFMLFNLRELSPSEMEPAPSPSRSRGPVPAAGKPEQVDRESSAILTGERP